ncbi:MAG: c-type cytochrome [Chthoniobacterales bacterium]
MLKYFFLLLTLSIIAVVSIAGFRGQHFKRPPIEIFPDMDWQPKVKAQAPSDFFADGRGNRAPVEGTVPLGYSSPLKDPVTGEVVTDDSPYYNIKFTASDDYVNTGKLGDQWGTGIPVKVDRAFMARGKQRYEISCRMCHGAVADGKGVVKEYGYATIADLQASRIRDMADGEIFNTITHGKSTMSGYGANIQVPDRWAIIAYLRALQLAQGATTADVPAEDLAELNAQPAN